MGAGAERGWAPSQLDPMTPWLPPPGVEAGPPGPCGLPAAPPAGSASRCARGPAATLLRDTGAGCVWDRTARKGMYTLSAPGIAILALTVIPVWSVPLQLQFWIRLGLSVASLSVELNDPPLFPAFFIILTKAWG